MKTKLIPALEHPNLKNKLTNLLDSCQSFMACTAFWTINVEYLPYNVLSQALKKPNSFICADIQFPTNIDNLVEFAKAGVDEIYLHGYRQHPEEYTQNTNLLHSKVYLFQLDNTNAFLLIGSHNFTRYAIEGLNLEASLAIECKITEPIFKETMVVN